MSHIWSASVSSSSSVLHGLVEYSSGILIKLFIISRAASKQSINKVAQNFSVKKKTTPAFSYLYACQTFKLILSMQDSCHWQIW